ncbi:MAG: hypothetical protein AAGD07_10230 [Planctomycetota bacterium]
MPASKIMLAALKTKWRLATALVCCWVVSAVQSHAFAQDGCCFEPAYRLECETVVQPRPVTRMRLTYDTQYVEQEQVTYRNVPKTRVEEREYRVARPITETSYREEEYTVYRPVVETSYRNETVTQTRYVTETAEREERYTTLRPVTETQMLQQRFTVQRPVVETQYRDQQYVVQRPVTETHMQTQAYTSYRPVTTMENQTIDAGGYVAQSVVTPGTTQYGLAWNPRAYAVPGPFGIFARVRGAATVAPYTTPPQVQTQYAYRPNYITQQVARTSYVPEVQQVQRPVTVTRMQSEVVNQRVPVQVQRMESQVVTQNVPVQTTRMVPTVEVRKIPYTVQRPVTETSTRQVPVQERKWVAEKRVRKIPVRSTRLVYETRKEPVTVRYYEQEEVRQKVLRPLTVPRYEPYTVTQYVPQQVVQRMPLSYVDPFSPAIIQGYSSFAPSTSSIVTQPSISSETVIRSDKPAVEDVPAGDGESDVLDSPANGDLDEPQSRLGEVEFGAPENAGASGDNVEEPSPSDYDQIDDPQLEDGRQTRVPAATSIRPVSTRPVFRPIAHRVRFQPSYLYSAP